MKHTKLIRMILLPFATVLIVGALTAGANLAYTSAVVSGQVTIEEPVRVTSQNPFQLQMFPGDTRTINIEIQNASPNTVSVALLAVIEPDSGGQLFVDIPQAVNIAAGQKIAVNASVIATNSVEPGTYAVKVNIFR